MMKKTLAICLGLALILTLCGTFAGAFGGEVENGIDAIEDAMMKGNTNTSSFFDGMDDLREGTSADTVPILACQKTGGAGSCSDDKRIS